MLERYNRIADRHSDILDSDIRYNRILDRYNGAVDPYNGLVDRYSEILDRYIVEQ